MSDMKCPVCGEILQKYGEVDPDTGTSIVLGANCPACGIGDSDIKLWQELIRTRKALDAVVDVLKEIDELLSSNKFDVKEVPLLNITQTKISMLLKCINIEQITALEQKE